jgi:UDP-glucose 4-epimerase
LRTPTSTKDYIYIDDLGEALLTVLEKRFEGCINLGSGIGISVREIAERLGKLVGRSDLIAEAFPPIEDRLDYVVANIGRLAALGWRPTTSMDLGLRNLLQNLHPDFS